MRTQLFITLCLSISVCSCSQNPCDDIFRSSSDALECLENKSLMIVYVWGPYHEEKPLKLRGLGPMYVFSHDAVTEVKKVIMQAYETGAEAPPRQVYERNIDPSKPFVLISPEYAIPATFFSEKGFVFELVDYDGFILSINQDYNIQKRVSRKQYEHLVDFFVKFAEHPGVLSL